MKKQHIIGLVLILIGAAILVFISEYSSTNLANQVARALGFTTGLVVLALIIFRKNTSLLLVIGVSWFIAAAWFSLQSYQRVSEDNRQAKQLVELSELYLSGEDVRDVAVNIKLGSIQELMKKSMEKYQAINNEYINAINSSGIDAALSPKNLVNSEMVKRNLVVVDELIKSGISSERKLLEAISTLDKELSLRTDRLGVEAYKGFLESKGQGIQQTNEYFKVQREGMNVYADILKFALANSEKYFEQNGQLMFQDQGALDAYNNLVEKLQLFTQEEARIQRETQQRAQKRIDTLKNEVGINQ